MNRWRCNTGKACNEPIAEQLLARISNDENLHMIFYRDVSGAGLDIAPNQAMKSLHRVLRNFKMPGYTVPDFRRKAVIIAMGGVYDQRIHLDDVVMPVLKKWRIFEREDFTGEGARLRDELAKLIEELEAGERGIYSGALGYLGIDGSADLGMVIRTIVFEQHGVRIGIGGGITSDSVPADELEETRIKAKALLEALGLDDPWSW